MDLDSDLFSTICDEVKPVSYAEVFSKRKADVNGTVRSCLQVLHGDCYEIPIIRAESSAIHCKNQERISVANPDPVLFDP